MCDEIDNDCDGNIDDADDDLDLSTGEVFYEDVDEDGFGSAVIGSLHSARRNIDGLW